MEGFDIRAPKGQKKNKRLGRGVGSGHGKTAGKGTQGPEGAGRRRRAARIRGRPDAAVPPYCAARLLELSFQEGVPGRQRVGPESVRRRGHRDGGVTAAKGLARKKGVSVKILGSGELDPEGRRRRTDRVGIGAGKDHRGGRQGQGHARWLPRSSPARGGNAGPGRRPGSPTPGRAGQQRKLRWRQRREIRGIPRRKNRGIPRRKNRGIPRRTDEAK